MKLETADVLYNDTRHGKSHDVGFGEYMMVKNIEGWNAPAGDQATDKQVKLTDTQHIPYASIGRTVFDKGNLKLRWWPLKELEIDKKGKVGRGAETDDLDKLDLDNQGKVTKKNVEDRQYQLTPLLSAGDEAQSWMKTCRVDTTHDFNGHTTKEPSAETVLKRKNDFADKLKTEAKLQLVNLQPVSLDTLVTGWEMDQYPERSSRACMPTRLRVDIQI